VAPLAALVRMDAMLSPGRLAAVLREFVEGRRGRSGSSGGSQASYICSLEEDHAGQHEQGRRRPSAWAGVAARLLGAGAFRCSGPQWDWSRRAYLTRRLCPIRARVSAIRARPMRSAAPDVRDVDASGSGRARRPLASGQRCRAYLLAYVHSDQARWRLGVRARPVRSRHGSTSPVMSRMWCGRLRGLRNARRFGLPCRQQQRAPCQDGHHRRQLAMFVRLTDPQGRLCLG